MESYVTPFRTSPSTIETARRENTSAALILMPISFRSIAMEVVQIAVEVRENTMAVPNGNP